jgi:hypothetical protein
MADENKPAFYPRVGNIKAKNFRSAQPMPFIDDERAMELPQYSESIRGLGKVDLRVPSKQNLELNRRITQRDADLMRQIQDDRSIPEKLAGGLQAGRFLGSAMTQGINSIPTRLFKGDEAADKFMEERIYKPEQPLAYEYAQDVGDFLEKLETEYKIPPLMPEALPLQHLSSPATSQAMRTAGRGAEQVGRKLESAMEPVVKGAFERGGLPREMVIAMGANTQSNVIKPYGGNWLGGGKGQIMTPEGDLQRLKVQDAPRYTHINEQGQAVGEGFGRPMTADELAGQGSFTNEKAINKWIDSNLTNYVKKEMGTRDDPVRKLAEEGIIHTPLREDLDRMEYLQATRKAEGYPAEGMGKSALAKQWENLADDAIRVTKAGKIQEMSGLSAKLDQARTEMNDHLKKLDQDFLVRMGEHVGNKDFNPKEVEMLMKMPPIQKAEILGDTKFAELKDNLYGLMAREQGFEKRAGEANPFVSKLDPETRLYSGSTYDLGFDHIIDVLREDVAAGRIRPEQLNKVSMEQAVRRTFEYDQELAKKMNEARLTARSELPVYKEYPEGLKWVELNRPGDFAAESDAMGHSVRGYEPPLGHPDWVKGSGDEGHSSYGLGGWEKIKSGKAKVYSLIDSKGEPHVTIETGQVFKPTYEKDLIPYKEAALEEAKLLPNGYTDADIKEIQIRMALSDKPFYINQIKGKQNAKPKDDYLPFVQDFVRGNNWSDVKDFKNTGLIREGGKIMTPAEHADWLLKELGADTYNELGLGGTPPAGMKRGGKVSISNNPDTMMLEVNNQKMKNGVPAYAGGKLIVGKGLKAAKPPKIEVPRLSMQFGNDLPINMNTAEVENLARRFPEPTVDRVNMAHKDVLKRTPELQEAAARIEAGDISADEYARLVQRYKPVTPYESVPAPASREEILAALSKTSREAEGLPRKETYFGKPSSTLKEGDPVGLRLDIPSYNQANTWVVTAHGPRKSPVSGGAGTRIGYEPVAAATDVDFSVSPKAALGIAKGAEKNTIATMEGKWKPTSSDEAFTLAKQYLKNPEWRQVGMDPERHSFFYDRETMAPVVNAEEVIQIGPLVLAKNPKFGKLEDFKYASGGLAHMKEGGSEDDAKPYFGGAGTKKYAPAKKRAEDADVNLLKDPRTYATVAGFMGERPDEMGFSVLHPDYQGVREAADPAFYAGTALGVAPMMKVLKAPAMALGRAGEKLAENVVPQIMERGGVGADILGGLAQGTRSNIHLPHTEKSPDPTVGTRYKRTDIGGLVPRKDLDIEKLDKSSVKVFPWDASDRNKLVTEVSDIPLTNPVLLEGGDNYMRDIKHVKKRIAGASNEGIANRIQDRIDQASVENQILGGTGKVFGFPIRMADKAEHASTFPTDIAMDLLKQGNLSRKELDDLTNELRGMSFEAKGKGYFQNVAPIDSPEFLVQLREGIKGNKEKGITSVTDMNLRRALMDRLSQKKFQKRLEYNYPDLIGSVIADELKGVPKGWVGNVSAELDPFSKIRPSKSSTYSHDFGGKYYASMPNMPVEFLMPNTFEGIYREMKALYPSAKPEALRNMAIGAMEKRKENISEMIGSRSIDAVKLYQEGLKQGEFDPNDIKQIYDYMRRKKFNLKLDNVKKAEGGYIKKPAAYIDGNEFVLAAQKYGIKDSMNNLNKIVDLVNKGYTVDDAARQVADTGMHKAAGGAIRGDDLILEERPL